MFDLNADDGSVRKKPYESPIPVTKEGEAPAIKASELDSVKSQGLHKRLMAWYLNEVDRQRDNRLEQAIDADFYDGIQWSAEDIATLQDRGQLALVYNVIATTINWIIGTEKQARTDFKILPRRKEDGEPAQRKTELFKYLSDVNREPFESSRAFEDAIKVGIGWMEDNVQDGDFEEPLTSQYESWRNILHDSSATKLDLSDARYIHRMKWVDQDIACAMFPERERIIKESINDADAIYSTDNYGDEAMDSQEIELEKGSWGSPGHPVEQYYQRQRVRMIETWFRIPVKAKRLKGSAFAGEIYDPASPGHREAVEYGMATLSEKVMMRVHVAIFTTKGLVWFSESPFRHNQLPFTPYWCYRRDRDGLPYGPIRNLRGPQMDVNKRASKALHILSSSKVMMEEGAVDDIEEFREEVARPDAIIVYNPGKKLAIDVDRDLAEGHVALMSRSIQMIQQVGGVTDELLGRQTNAASGIAVQSRQSQGVLANASPFDHLRYAKQVRGEKILSNIEQFISEEKAFRITNRRGKPTYSVVNDGLPENDIVRSKADFKIDEADWNATIRQASANALFDVLKTFPPELAITILDLVIENTDLPNREEIVRRIRSFSGQPDPDAEEPTPEEQAKAAAAQEQEQFQKAMAAATLKKLLADASLSEAKTQESTAKMVGLGVDAEAAALVAARDAMALPESAHVADQILHEVGFVSRSEKEQELAEVARQQQAAAEQAQMAQQAQQAQQQTAPQQQQDQPQPEAQPGPAGLGPEATGQ